METSETGLMSKTRAAAYLGCTERTLDNLKGRGGPAPVRVAGRCMYKQEDLDAYVRRRQSHRIDPREDLSKFETTHVERQQVESGRRRPRSFLLTPTTTNANDVPLVLTEAQFEVLTKLANLSGNVGWHGDDLSQAQARMLLQELGWLEQVVVLLRAGRGLRVEKEIAI